MKGEIEKEIECRLSANSIVLAEMNSSLCGRSSSDVEYRTKISRTVVDFYLYVRNFMHFLPIKACITFNRKFIWSLCKRLVILVFIIVDRKFAAKLLNITYWHNINRIYSIGYLKIIIAIIKIRLKYIYKCKDNKTILFRFIIL